MEANIAKTKDSILKLERHFNNRTCPKSLQYSAKANIASDSTFRKEIKDIKQTAEQHLLTPSHASINEGLTALETNLTQVYLCAKVQPSVALESYLE